jgi:hypothetical protein
VLSEAVYREVVSLLGTSLGDRICDGLRGGQTTIVEGLKMHARATEDQASALEHLQALRLLAAEELFRDTQGDSNWFTELLDGLIRDLIREIEQRSSPPSQPLKNNSPPIEGRVVSQREREPFSVDEDRETAG